MLSIGFALKETLIYTKKILKSKRREIQKIIFKG